MDLSNLLMGVAYAAPSLIVYLIAFVLGIVFLNKYKPAGLFTMLGGMIAGLAVLGSLVVRQFLMAKMREDGGDMKSTADVLGGVGFVGQVFEVIGMAMILFAVFAGRKQAKRDDDEPTERASRRRS